MIAQLLMFCFQSKFSYTDLVVEKSLVIFLTNAYICNIIGDKEVVKVRKDIVILGGGPAGLLTAATATKNFPDKSVLLVRKEEVGMVPCGIPYIFSTIGNVEGDILGLDNFKKLGVEFLFEEAMDVDFSSKKVKTASGKEIEYDKLVLALGSKPITPRIEGIDLEGIFPVSKYKSDLEKIFSYLKESKKVVIVGGGFIGVEVGDEIRKQGKDVTIVEALDHLLPTAFDPEFGELLEKNLAEKGVKIFTNRKVTRFVGSGKVEKVVLENGEELEADIVLISIGYRPNVDLVKDKGIRMGEGGGIWVDEYMRTSIPNVFAVGDCAEHRCFFTRRPSKLMLASTATFEARIAGTNLYGLKVFRRNKGTLGIFSTSIEGLTLATAGIIEKVAKEEGFEYIVGEATGIDRHPGTIPDKSQVKLKLLFSKVSLHLLGGQIAGGKSVGEMINILAMALQTGATANDLFTLQIGTHPLLTAPPTAYPIISAAENALMKVKC